MPIFDESFNASKEAYISYKDMIIALQYDF